MCRNFRDSSLFVFFIGKDDALESQLLLNSVEIGRIRPAISRRSSVSVSLVMNTIPNDAVVTAADDRESDCECELASERRDEKGKDFPTFFSVRDISCPAIAMKLLFAISDS